MAIASKVQRGKTITVTAAADLVPGTVVIVDATASSPLVGICMSYVASGASAEIEIENVFDVPKLADGSSGIAFKFGDSVYFDLTLNSGSGYASDDDTKPHMGVCVLAAAKADGSVRVKLMPRLQQVVTLQTEVDGL